MAAIPIFLIGAGGHAASCIDVIEQSGHFAVVALVGTSSEVGSEFLGYSVVGTDKDLPELVAKHRNAIIAIGQIKSPDTRIRLFQRLEEIGCNLPVIVSPQAYVSTRATIGAGTIVMHGAVINAGAVIGRNCIVNSMSLIEHDARIEDHCHIATAAVVNGNVSIGAGAFVGSQSCIREGLKIGERCLIGMGQHVLKDCPPMTRIPPKSIL